eukprot:9042021-Pyramimonas_sp.AAC.1
MFDDWLSTVPLNKNNFYLFIDSSPQRRGLGLHAASIDMWVDGVFRRKLLPCASLGKEFLDKIGKTVATLWQLFLMFGPSFNAM